ncbi:MAG: hypothetical protein ACKVOE_09570 [Rickettsiales bacterium]
MEQEYTPLNHGALSATGTTVSEAAKGGLSGLWKGGLIGLLAPIGIGMAVLAGGGLLFSASLATLGTLAAIGAGVGAIGSFWTTGIGLGIGTLFGTVKGATRGIDRVSGEKAASQMMSAQVEAYKAQAQTAGTNIYAPQVSNKYGFPDQGAAMNPALANVQLSGAQYDGVAAGQQRAAGLA